MKLYCFVILVFISVIFAVGEEREWGNGGIRRGKNISPVSKRSLNPIPENIGVNHLSTNNQEKGPEASTTKNPQPTHTKPINENDKAKHDENSAQQEPLLHDQNADANKDTAKKLEEETQTINKVIVVLGSLGASLLLVAIAIAVLYLKVRKQQQHIYVKNKHHDVTSSSKGSSNGGENTGGNTNENDDNIKRGDDGIGVGIGGNGETSECNALSMAEKPNIPNIPNMSPNMPNIINNSDLSADNRVVGNKVTNEVYMQQFQQFHNIQQQLPPPVQPSAPSAEKFERDDDNLDNNASNSNLSFPHLAAPPAYTPTAPPIYALPHSPIPISEFDGSMIMYMNGNYQQNSHYLETNNDDGNNSETFVRISPLHPSVSLPPPNTGVWYAAGPTSQTNIPTDNTPIDNTPIDNIPIDSTPYQSNNSTIIHPSSNPHENNNDNKLTHQRSTI